MPSEVSVIVLRTVLLVAVFALASHPSSARAQSRTEAALVRRVDSLERRIAELESRIARLESIRPQSPAVPGEDNRLSLELTNWRRLREDMSYDAVRRILGEPETIKGGTVAFWTYPNAGQVGFVSGKLISWTEPSRR